MYKTWITAFTNMLVWHDQTFQIRGVEIVLYMWNILIKVQYSEKYLTEKSLFKYFFPEMILSKL